MFMIDKLCPNNDSENTKPDKYKTPSGEQRLGMAVQKTGSKPLGNSKEGTVNNYLNRGGQIDDP